MKMRAIAYWASTGLVALGMVFGGVLDAMRGPQVAEIFQHLGYPLYFGLILGVWKVLGGVALVAPKLPLVKEWAYAGIAFDLTGAAASHAAVGDPAANILTPLVLFVLLLVSWALRPASRRLPGTAVLPSSEEAPRPAVVHAS